MSMIHVFVVYVYIVFKNVIDCVLANEIVCICYSLGRYGKEFLNVNCMNSTKNIINYKHFKTHKTSALSSSGDYY